METSLCTSDILILVAIAALLTSVTALAVARRRTERWVAGSGMHRVSGLALGVAILAAGGSVASSCPTGKFASCPTPLTGTGYVCPTPPPACGIFGGSVCKTVAGTMPWDSDCECKCK